MKKALSIILVVLLCLSFTACGEKKEDKSETPAFPEHEIEIIVPAGAGGGSDLWARAMGEQLANILGVPVNVSNMPGGNEAIAREEMMSRDADGYTLMITTSTQVTEIALGNNTEPDALVGLALVHQDTYGLHVKDGGKFTTIDELVAYATEHPGEVLVGGTYPKSLDEITINLFEKAAGIDVTYVPYDDAGQMQADVLGGHIDAMIDEFATVKDLIEAKSIIPVLAFSSTTLALYPEVPTSVDKGWDVTDGMLRGILIKVGTPDEIVKILEDAIEQAYNTDAYKEFAASRMLDLRDVFCKGADFQTLITEKVTTYKEILDSLE